MSSSDGEGHGRANGSTEETMELILHAIRRFTDIYAKVNREEQPDWSKAKEELEVQGDFGHSDRDSKRKIVVDPETMKWAHPIEKPRAPTPEDED